MIDTRRLLLASVLWTGFVSAAPAALPSRPTGYVNDDAGVLSERARSAIEGVMTELQQKTGAEVAVVTAASLDGRDVAEVAEKLFHEWGIGSKSKNDGVLLLVAPTDRRARIEVGYGLEGLIPDGRAGRILDEQAVPRFRAGDIEGGVAATALTIAEIIAVDRGVTLTGVAPLRPEPKSSSNLLLIILFIAALIVFRRPWMLLYMMTAGGRGGRGGGWPGGSGGFGGFGGFGGGSFGGGGASRGW